jgi:high affinity Mn2+ porin
MHYPLRSTIALLATSLCGFIDPLFAEDRATAQGIAPSITIPSADGNGMPSSPSDSLDDPAHSIPRFDGWSLHCQSTVIRQQHWKFSSPYVGTNSLSNQDDTEHTWTVTGFIGRKLWADGEVYVDPELSQGIGFGNTTGIAGFPNGEATRAASSDPHYYFARYFFRQSVNLGGGSEGVTDDKNQIAGTLDRNRLVITIGKVAASDFFDANSYAHDPRTQFLNWALFETGAWDYPADARGYTHGAVLEWITPRWAVRMGTFMEPKEANGLELDDNVSRAHGDTAEIELDYEVLGHGGKTRVLGFHNRAHMGDYRQAVVGNALTRDLGATRRYSSKQGVTLNLEQEICPWAGAFLRLGWNDGGNETWAFTEIDQSAAAGCSFKGRPWHRPDDVLGVAGLINGLSPDHRAFISAGGVGFIIGDGKLNYGLEEIFETYYCAQLCPAFAATLDFQVVGNPAYNRDRGPVSILAFRGHVDL